MGILCAICNEQINFNAELYVTPCGHIFHFGCLTQWLPRSSTCPECRRKTTLSTIQKLYLNVRNDESLLEDPYDLQEAASELSTQNEMLKTKVSKLEENLEAADKKSREKILKLEENLLKKDAAFDVVKRQCDHYRAQVGVITELEQKVKSYEEKEKLNTKITDLLTLSANEVDSMMSGRDITTHDLKIFVSALKRELRSSESKRQNIKVAYQHSQHDLIQCRTKLDQYKKKMENFSDAERKLATAEVEKSILTGRIQELEEMSEEKKLAKPKPVVPDSDSPYLQIESSSVGIVPLRLLNGNDLAKRQRLENNKYSIFKKPRLTTAHSMSSIYGPSTSQELNSDAKPSTSAANTKKGNSVGVPR